MHTNFTHYRNRDFVRACRRRLEQLRSEGQNPTVIQLIDDVLAAPAPSYYIDYFYACNIMVGALKGEPLPDASYCSSSCWADMFADLEELLRRNPTKSLRGLIWSLCAGEAGHPRFYISRRRAHAILKPYLTNNYTIQL